METNSITDYLQTLNDIIPAIQLGLFPDNTIGQVYHVLAESNNISTTPTIMGSNPNQDPFNTVGDVLYLSSAAIADTQQIYIEGILYSDGTIAGEVATLQGRTGVQLSNVYKTILRAYNNNGTSLTEDAYIGTEAAPTNGVPADDNIYAHIPAVFNNKTYNTTITTTFTVPKGYTAFLTSWTASMQRGRDISLAGYARLLGKTFVCKELVYAYQNTSHKTLPWLKFPEFTDFKCEATTTATLGTPFDGVTTFDVVLLKNDFIEKFRPLHWR